MNLFKRLSLIDSVTKFCLPDGSVSIVAVLLPLGAFRENPVPGESMHIAWYYRGQKMIKYTNMTSIVIPKSQKKYDWKIRVILNTPWVKKDDQNLLRSNKRISLRGC